MLPWRRTGSEWPLPYNFVHGDVGCHVYPLRGGDGARKRHVVTRAGGIVICMVLVGPSAPSGALFARSLPVEAVKEAVPHRVMTWNICNPCKASNVDRAAEIATYAPQIVGLQEACVRDVEKIRDQPESRCGLVSSSTGCFLGIGAAAVDRRGVQGPSARRSSRRHR